MGLNRIGLAVCAAILLLAGCKQPTETQRSAAEVAPAVATETANAAEAASAEEADAGTGNPTISTREGLGLGLAMLVGAEQCGVTKPAESQAALVKMKIKAQAEGISASEVDSMYRAVEQQMKAEAAKDPARMERDCAGMRKLADPAEIKKMEEATKALEKKVAEMEAAAR